MGGGGLGGEWTKGEEKREVNRNQIFLFWQKLKPKPQRHAAVSGICHQCLGMFINVSRKNALPTVLFVPSVIIRTLSFIQYQNQ